MARREILVDDYDGTVADEETAVETRRFSVGRMSFTIDLTDDNYDKMLAEFKPWMDVATQEEAPARALRASTAAPRQRAPRPNGQAAPKKAITKAGKTAQEVREALRAEGYEVSDRGRFSKEQKEKYEYHSKDTFL
jgi:hypothetical protein